MLFGFAAYAEDEVEYKMDMGAGLGGGSSDAAFTLLAINDVFELGLSLDTLAGIAAQLGSDCPFFIYNQPMFASGRGEILEPYPLDLTGYHIEVVTPGIHISTPEAYKGVDAVKFGIGADDVLAAAMLQAIDSADASRPPFPLLCSALDESLAKRGDILPEAFSRLRNCGAASEEIVRVGNRRDEPTGPERSYFGASAGRFRELNGIDTGICLRGRNVEPRCHYFDTVRGKVYVVGFENLAAPARKHRTVVNEERAVAAQLGSNRRQPFFIEAQLKDGIDGSQGKCGVAAASAQAGAHRYIFI